MFLAKLNVIILKQNKIVSPSVHLIASGSESIFILNSLLFCCEHHVVGFDVFA